MAKVTDSWLSNNVWILNISASHVISENCLAYTITLSFFPNLINFHCTHTIQYSAETQSNCYAEFWCSFSIIGLSCIELCLATYLQLS